MKKLLAAALLVSASTCVAQEENSPKHSFSPKGFYKYHKEKNYTHNTAGIGVEYSFYKPQGINIKLCGLTNFRREEVFVETEATLFFRYPVNYMHNLYPIFSSKSFSHKIEENDKKKVFINTSTAYAGMGWEMIFSPMFQIKVEGLVFHDLSSSLIFIHPSHFWGRSYSNPSGGKVKLGFTTKWKERFFISIEGHYAHTIQKCYKECGTDIKFKWAF